MNEWLPICSIPLLAARAACANLPPKSPSAHASHLSTMGTRFYPPVSPLLGSSLPPLFKYSHKCVLISHMCVLSSAPSYTYIVVHISYLFFLTIYLSSRFCLFLIFSLLHTSVTFFSSTVKKICVC